jgi:hypothetical protein
LSLLSPLEVSIKITGREGSEREHKFVFHLSHPKCCLADTYLGAHLGYIIKIVQIAYERKTRKSLTSVSYFRFLVPLPRLPICAALKSSNSHV